MVKTGIILAIVTAIFALYADSNTWELKIKKAGIMVFTKDETGSQYKSFKASTVMDVTIEKVINILKDGNGYKKWLAFTKKSRVLNESINEQYIYIETSLPWPYKNEDMIYRMTMTTEGKMAKKFNLKGVPDYMPPVKGINRMQRANGYILLSTVTNGTKIIYSMHSELSGSIPVWMANDNIWELSFQTLKNLKNVIKE